MENAIWDFLLVNSSILIGVAGGLVLAVLAPPVFSLVKSLVPKIGTGIKSLFSTISGGLQREAARAKVDVLVLDTKVTALESAVANAVIALEARLASLETTTTAATPPNAG